MDIVALITGVLKLANWIAEYAANRQLINAGVYEAVAKGTSYTLEEITQAKKAKHAMDHNIDPDWVKRVRDKYRRPGQ